MSKIYYDKQKHVFQMFVPYPILPFSHIWNPQEDKIINQEHLKKFIEEGFLYNFKRSGPFFVFFDKNNNTPFSDFCYIYTYALFNYLVDEDKICYKDCDNFLQFFVDSSAVYKLFSHLISEEKFSLLLEKQFNQNFGKDFISQEDLEFFTFISSREKLYSLEKELILFQTENEIIFSQYLEKLTKSLDDSKKTKYTPKSEEKLSTSFEELDKYLNEVVHAKN